MALLVSNERQSTEGQRRRLSKHSSRQALRDQQRSIRKARTLYYLITFEVTAVAPPGLDRVPAQLAIGQEETVRRVQG